MVKNLLLHYRGVTIHKTRMLWVGSALLLKLFVRLLLHDLSKYRSSEAVGYSRITPSLNKVVYGSPEYLRRLGRERKVIDLHYSRNRHHPGHFKEGVSKMTLVDFVEMAVDWKAASVRPEAKRRLTWMETVFENRNRFKLSDSLVRLLLNKE